MSDQTGSWQPDPFGRNQYRYWDGTQWTDQVSNDGVVGTDPATATPTPEADPGSQPTQAVPTTPPTTPAEPTMAMPTMPPAPPSFTSGDVAVGPGGGSNKTPLIVVAVLAVVALIAGGAFFFLKDDDSDKEAASSTSTTVAQSTTTSTTDDLDDEGDSDFDLSELGPLADMFGDLTVSQLQCIEKEMAEFEKKYDVDSLGDDPEDFDFGMLSEMMGVFTKCDVDAAAIFGALLGGEFDPGQDDDFDFGFQSGNSYGDNPALDALWDACDGGDMEACDDLFFQSDFGTEYEEFADTCGGRTSGGTYCSE